METSRIHWFKVGRLYRVLRAIKTRTDCFEVGELVTFQGTSYSRYDESSGFLFKNTLDGELKAWYLHDDEPDNSKVYFEELGSKPDQV